MQFGPFVFRDCYQIRLEWSFASRMILRGFRMAATLRLHNMHSCNKIIISIISLGWRPLALHSSTCKKEEQYQARNNTIQYFIGADNTHPLSDPCANIHWKCMTIFRRKAIIPTVKVQVSRCNFLSPNINIMEKEILEPLGVGALSGWNSFHVITKEHSHIYGDCSR